MGKLIVLNSSGHTEVAWRPDDAATVASAEREFRKLALQGYVPFEKDGEDVRRLNGFEPGLGDVYMLRPLKGGQR